MALPLSSNSLRIVLVLTSSTPGASVLFPHHGRTSIDLVNGGVTPAIPW
ncbi:Uncharacterised protein [Amycolatopsis camponoti]|uniref:Uncharacterized protein n=1 Tax=Amycolatopsis camponoti TaxID=2606593 RepID=A0A6I8LGI8_9PSEU|nr:Uncharacterised protein [Amycolatopsis camponoti]